MAGGELAFLAFPGMAMKQAYGRKLHPGLLNIKMLLQPLAQEVLDYAVPGTGRIYKGNTSVCFLLSFTLFQSIHYFEISL